VAGIAIVAFAAVTITVLLTGRHRGEEPAQGQVPGLPDGLSGILGGIPNVPHPPGTPPKPGDHAEWNGLDNKDGELVPAASRMQLTFAQDGKISGSSTDVSITGGGSPVRSATVTGRVSDNKVTFTKTFGDSSAAIDYEGTIDPSHHSMSGTWRRGD